MPDHAKSRRTTMILYRHISPRLPDGAKYDEAEGGVPEKQPNQKPKEK